MDSTHFVHGDSANSVRRDVVIASQYGSASTWTSDLVASILGVGNDDLRVYQRCSDKLDGFASRRSSESTALVIKARAPDGPLRAAMKRGDFSTILTLRNPIDAVASLISRYNESFDAALDRVSHAAASLVPLHGMSDALVLRFEDDFTDDPTTIPAICQWLGADIPAEAQALVARMYAREQVRQKIFRYQPRVDISGGDVEASEPTPHRRHDTNIEPHPRRWSDVLSLDQVRRTVEATLGYCETFDYLSFGYGVCIGDLHRDARTLDQLVHQIRDEFLQSASWRITRPLRAICEALRP
jgi:hypothetical protein